MTISSRRVVITGAAGNLGSKLRRHLRDRSDLELVLVDLKGDPASGIMAADLATADPRWAALFRGGDVVVHLAAEAGLAARHQVWSRLQARNVDAMLNVFEAAARAGCSKVIFASSLRVLEGYRDRAGSAVPPGAEPSPQTPYAITKAFGERVGHLYATQRGLPVVCLRIGVVRPGHNPPPTRRNAWVQSSWLSDADFCAAVEKAIDADADGFVVVPLTSRIAGSPADLEIGARELGYRPRDAWEPDRPAWRASLRLRLAVWLGPWLERVLLRLRA
jgi:nucleoside-diphosphate-sugar epimerase